MKKPFPHAAVLLLAMSGALWSGDTSGGQPRPAAGACSVVLYGDSIMHGGYVDGTGTQRHPRHLSAELRSRRAAWTVDDRTVSGQSLEKMSEAFHHETRAAHVVVLGSGIAEAWAGGDVKRQLAQLVHDVRDEGRVPILTGYARQLPNGLMTPDRLAGRDRADADVKALAAELHVPFADFGAAGPVEIIDEVHPTQAYSLRITGQLIRALDRVAPGCSAPMA